MQRTIRMTGDMGTDRGKEYYWECGIRRLLSWVFICKVNLVPFSWGCCET